jgi:hypothetical protein
MASGVWKRGVPDESKNSSLRVQGRRRKRCRRGLRRGCAGGGRSGDWRGEAVLREEITAVDEALRAVVVRDAQDGFAYPLEAEEGWGPGFGRAFGRVLIQELGEVYGGPLGVHGGNPVGGDEGDVPVSVDHASGGEEGML